MASIWAWVFTQVKLRDDRLMKKGSLTLCFKIKDWSYSGQKPHGQRLSKSEVNTEKGRRR
jgi:hypothetical protein